MTTRIESGSVPSERGWPAEAPQLEVAECALVAALEGAPPPFAELAAAADRVARELTELERRALRGALTEVDALPIRRAAAMRLRVGVAIATSPAPGVGAEPDAVAALLSEIDGLVSEVNAVAAGAPAALAAAIGRCRGALVKEAIDFSEVAQRHATADARDVEPDAAVLATPEARRLSRRARVRLVVALVAVVIAAVAAWAGCPFLS